MKLDSEFIRKCLWALGVLAFLAITEYAVLEFQNREQTNQAHLINRTGYQRMLTQRIAWLATRLVLETEPQARLEIRPKLASSIDKLESWHNSLLSISEERVQPTLQAVYFQSPMHLDAHMQRYIDEAKALAAAPDVELKPGNVHFTSLTRMADTNTPLLKGLEQSIGIMEQEEINHTRFLNLLFLGLIAINLGVLVLVWTFIFRPMLSMIQREQETVIQSQKAFQQAIEEVQLLQNIAFAMSETENLEAAFEKALFKVCEVTGWQIGQVWIPSDDGAVLQCSPAWHNTVQGAEAFRQVSLQTTFLPGVGLPGRVWTSKQPSWIRDVTQDKNFPRAPVAQQVGLETAMGIPILAESDVVAVIEFFMFCPRPEDDRLTQLISTVAAQLGPVVQRKRAEEALQRSEESLRQAHQQLEEKVEIRTLELKQVNKQLKNELSERKRLESQLIQAQKMESLGQLAAGVAHEINNPVGFVMSNLGTLSKYVAVFKQLLEQYDRLATMDRLEGQTNGKGEVLARIDEIRLSSKLDYILEDIDNLLVESRDGTCRVREIVQGLKSFSRLDESEIKEADLNECIESTLKIVWNELKYKCRVHKHYGEIPALRCYPGQLNQVFMNFLVNAAQSIPDQGEIFIETGVRDEYAMIRFKDTGSGIPPEVLPHIFDPFFTTKAVGKGTGLGLSISYGIIQKHHGQIEVDSEVGKGTTFTLLLPLTGVVYAEHK